MSSLLVLSSTLFGAIIAFRNKEDEAAGSNAALTHFYTLWYTFICLLTLCFCLHAFICFNLLPYAYKRFLTLTYAFICFHTLTNTFICFDTPCYACICLHTLPYAFICFHMLCYAYIPLHMLSYAFNAFIRFHTLSYAFICMLRSLNMLTCCIMSSLEEEQEVMLTLCLTGFCSAEAGKKVMIVAIKNICLTFHPKLKGLIIEKF